VPLTHIHGAELEATWHPIDRRIFNLGYSYLNSRIAQSACVQDTTDPLAIMPGADTKGCTVAGAQNIVGQAIPQATPNKISFNGLYTFAFDPGKLTLSGTVIWKDAPCSIAPIILSRPIRR
jgi:outer membrane receptor protein involved in Fe transport